MGIFSFKGLHFIFHKWYWWNLWCIKYANLSCRYNLACHRLETLLQNIDLPPLNSANNAQYFLRKPDKAVEEDSRVFSAYQDCIQLQLQLNLAHHAVQRLRVSLGATRKHLPENYDPRELVQNSSTEQLRTIIRYLLDTLLSLLHCCNGEGGSLFQYHLTVLKWHEIWNDLTLF